MIRLVTCATQPPGLPGPLLGFADSLILRGGHLLRRGRVAEAAGGFAPTPGPPRTWQGRGTAPSTVD
ncbi:hypothetical protein AB0L86_10005 [Micromonospora musae]|uniref:hypothetical protein n=1 Tax=Micromonospora musae TaxID=1894970 RepID=UPI0034496872